MNWLNKFLNRSVLPEVTNIKKEMGPLKVKLGELGARIAIDSEKGIEPTELLKMEYDNTAEMLTAKLKELKELITYKLQKNPDQKIAAGLQSELEQAEREIDTLARQTKKLAS